MRSLEELLRKAVSMGAADVFIISGTPVSCKFNGEIVPLDEERVLPDTAETLIREIYAAANRRR